MPCQKETPQASKDDSRDNVMTASIRVPIASENKRRRKLSTAASTAFESIEDQDPGGSSWNLLGTCCKCKHDHRLGCRPEGIGCMDGIVVTPSSVLSDAIVERGKAKSEIGPDSKMFDNILIVLSVINLVRLPLV